MRAEQTYCDAIHFYRGMRAGEETGEESGLRNVVVRIEEKSGRGSE